MKLTKIERRILAFVDRKYPISTNKYDNDRMIAVGERPLATAEEISKTFSTPSGAEIQAAIAKLTAFQCIQPVYLHGKSDYVEVALFPGKTLRLPVAKPGSGTQALQVTEIGKATIKETLGFKLLHLLQKVGARFADKYLP